METSRRRFQPSRHSLQAEVRRQRQAIRNKSIVPSLSASYSVLQIYCFLHLRVHNQINTSVNLKHMCNRLFRIDQLSTPVTRILPYEGVAPEAYTI